MAYHKREFFAAVFGCVLLTALAGCSTLIEGAKGLAGISTKALEEGRAKAIKKTFNYNYSVCYNESLRILKEKGQHIYAQDPKKMMIAAYISENDTTPVGIFFKVVDDAHTQVEVSSPSTYGKEFISKKLFYALENLNKKEKEEDKKDAKGKVEGTL